MSDIVERLETTDVGSTILCREAAQEIRRLRVHNKSLVDSLISLIRFFSDADPEVADE
jgi:hypothetical protein